jgi:hypothetical protein
MTFKIVQVDRQASMFHQSVQLDLTRATAILYRQSKRGSDKTHIESRMLQESLKPFVIQARGEDSDENIHIFDEGAGVSGTKGIDKRKKLRELHVEIASNLIGDIVLARPDRLFRDKHFANVSTFTQLAEKMQIKVIVPTDRGVVVYDFTREKDLQAFQEAMIQAYAYIVNQIGYMNRARAFKVSKGYYGGGTISLPYVLLRDMPKEEQTLAIYEPWREAAVDLFQHFKDFNFESGRITRYVEDKPYIFRFMEPAHLEEYLPVTNLTRANGGYTFISRETLLSYLSNLTLAGFAKAGRDGEGNDILIPGIFDAAIPLDLFEPCFASLTGSYLDGTPFVKAGTARQYRRQGIETDAILHGLLTSDDGTISTYAQLDVDRPVYTCRRGGYFGQRARVGLGRMENVWALPIRPIDRIVLDRLIALAEYDNELVERVKAYFGERAGEGESDLEVLDTAIKNTQDAIIRVGKTIVALTKGLVDDQGNPIALPENDPNIKEQRDLYIQLRRLQKQREKAAEAANEDPAKSITDFYYVLSHLRAEFNKKDPQTKKDIMKKLIEEVKITAISPHLLTLHITWIKPLATSRDRDDVALLWRGTPNKSPTTNYWTEDELAALRTLWPDAPHTDIMHAIPNKTSSQIKDKAWELGIRRDFHHLPRGGRFHLTIAQIDLQAAAAFTECVKEQDFLWREINAMAERTRKGDISAMWFLPIDAISFAQSFSVTDVLDTGVSAQTAG